MDGIAARTGRLFNAGRCRVGGTDVAAVLGLGFLPARGNDTNSADTRAALGPTFTSSSSSPSSPSSTSTASTTTPAPFQHGIGSVLGIVNVPSGHLGLDDTSVASE